jgi:lysophospholipase L1-like esterase
LTESRRFDLPPQWLRYRLHWHTQQRHPSMKTILFSLLVTLAVQPAQARAIGTLRVVCIGDSITQGCGHLGKDTDPPTYGWRYAFWKDCVAAGYPVEMVGSIDTGANGTPEYDNFKGKKFNNRHESRWGWTTEQIRDQLKQTSLHWKADLALIHLGDNSDPQTEAEKSSDPEGIERTVKAMRDVINILRANNPKIVIVLRAPDGGSTRNNGLDVAYKKLAAQLGSAASPILTADLPADWVADPNQPDTDTRDGCHPNPKGDKKIADGYFKAAQNIISSGRR